jgi:hypothetical protein
VALCADHLLGLERVTDADIIAVADRVRVTLIAGMPDD